MEHIKRRRKLSKLFSNLSLRSRKEKFEKFIMLMNPSFNDRILYIGGAIGTENVDLESFFLESYSWLENVTVVDINEQGLQNTKKRFSKINICCCDTRKTPFSNDEFDICFCNAVIEHVGNYKDQKVMANEIMRVSKKWFIATPNFWFPFEFHYHLPFIHYFPLKVQRFLKMFIGGRYPRGKISNINLLTAKKLKKLFPASKIIRQCITFWSESIIAYSNKERITL